MKGIILKDFEVRRLASAGIVLIWRRVKFAYKPEGDEQFIRMQPGFQDGSTRAIFEGLCSEDPFSVKCPHGRTGETRFVKETGYWIRDGGGGKPCVAYRAENVMKPHGCSWLSPATMPSWASRFRVTLSISCRQIQSVTEEEAARSGAFLSRCKCSVMQAKPRTSMEAAFTQTWCHIHGNEFKALHKESWERNEWKWVIEAKEVK